MVSIRPRAAFLVLSPAIVVALAVGGFCEDFRPTLKGIPLPVIPRREVLPADDPSREDPSWIRIDLEDYEPIEPPLRRIDASTTERDVPAGGLVRYNFRTQEVTRLPPTGPISDALGVDAEPASQRLVRRASKGNADQPTGEFGFARVRGTTRFPFRTVTNLRFTFESPSGKELSQTGSGALIDPTHLITAGHCVYRHPDDKDDDDEPQGWIVAMAAIPGMDDGEKPFGGAHALNAYSWDGWVDDADFDHDIAIVELSWPIGVSVGHLGYGWSDDCGFFRSRTFTTAGFPGEEFNGQRMYFWMGSFFDCDTTAGVWHGEEVRIHPYARTGQSGSGAWTDRDGYPAVYAILSNKVQWLFQRDTDFPRITEDKYHDIRERIRANRESRIDLVPVRPRPQVDVARPGEIVPEVRYRIFNNSRSGFQGILDVRMLLIEKEAIDDVQFFTEVHRHRVTFGSPLASGGWVEVVMEQIEIPEFLDPGQYRLRIETLYDDAIPENNQTDSHEPIDFTVLSAGCHGRSLVNADGIVASVEPRTIDGALSDPEIGHHYRIRTHSSGRHVFAMCDVPAEFDAGLCLYTEEFERIEATSDGCAGSPRISVDLESGTYFVAVSAPPGQTGAYSLSVQRELRCLGYPLIDRGSLEPEGQWKTVSGELDSFRADGYGLSVTDPGLYTFSFCNGSGVATFDSVLCLFDALGNVVEEVDDNCGTRGTRSEMTVELHPGRYFLAVTAAGTIFTDYRLAYRRIGLCGGEDLSRAGVLDVELQRQAINWSTDAASTNPYYELRVPDDSLVTLQTCATPEFLDYLTDMCLYDTSWNLVTSGDPCDGGGLRIASFLESGTYYLGLSGPRGAKGGFTLEYQLSPSCDGDQNTLVGLLEPVVATQALRGTLNVAVADGYVVEAAVAGTYTFSTCRSRMDTALCLYSDRWDLIRNDFDGCFGRARIQIALQKGTYVLMVTGEGDDSGKYTLEHSVVPLCGRSELNEVDTPLQPTAEIQYADGNVAIREGDLYPVDVASSGTCRFDLCGAGGIASFDSLLCLYDGEGRILAKNDDACGKSSTIERELPAGRYYLGIASSLAREEGPYRLAYQLLESTAPAGGWIRCDHNCDGTTDITDTISGLTELFIDGRRAACCEAIADCNSDTEHDLSDWIFLLDVLFLGAQAPAEPFHECGGTGCEAYPHCEAR